MTFTEAIYESWMKDTQEMKYEGIYMDFLLPSQEKIDIESSRVLDVGIGKGWFEDFLERKGMSPETVVGVDTVPRESDRSFVLADGDALPFRDSSFDIVISLDTIHLLENPQELVRVLADGGFLLVSDFYSMHSTEVKKVEMMKGFDELKLLKEGVVGDERELDYVALFEKV